MPCKAMALRLSKLERRFADAATATFVCQTMIHEKWNIKEQEVWTEELTIVMFLFYSRNWIFKPFIDHV